MSERASAALRAATGLEYVGPHSRVVGAVQVLLAEGWVEPAITLARVALDDGVPEQVALELRCLLVAPLIATGRIAQAVAAADRVLLDPNLTPDRADEAAAGRLFGLMARGELTSEDARASLSDRDPAGAWRARTAVALTVLSHLEWGDGNITKALHWGGRSTAQALSVDASVWRWLPPLMLAEKLGVLGEFDEAEELLHRSHEEIDQYGLTVHLPHVELAWARLLLREGRWAAGRASAETSLSSAMELGTWLVVPPALATLALVALHAGDTSSADAYLRRYRTQPNTGKGWYASARDEWIQLMMRAATTHPSNIDEQMLVDCAGLLNRRVLLVEEPSMAAWLVRLAVDVGDEKLAMAAIDAAQDIAAANTGTRATACGALHARSLFEQDLEGLAQAASEHPDAWARICAAQDMQALLTRGFGAGGQRVNGREVSQAASRSEDGVGRQRTVVSPHSDNCTSWPELTDTERAIVDLVSKGLTNRQVARRIYLSPHTVNYHLRQIFRKFAIRSRVELANIVHQDPR